MTNWFSTWALSSIRKRTITLNLTRDLNTTNHVTQSFLLYDSHHTGWVRYTTLLLSRESSAHARVQKSRNKTCTAEQFRPNRTIHSFIHFITAIAFCLEHHRRKRNTVTTCSCRINPSADISTISKLTGYLRQMIFYGGKCNDCNRYCSNSAMCPTNIFDLVKEVNITHFLFSSEEILRSKCSEICCRVNWHTVTDISEESAATNLI